MKQDAIILELNKAIDAVKDLGAKVSECIKSSEVLKEKVINCSLIIYQTNIDLSYVNGFIDGFFNLTNK